MRLHVFKLKQFEWARTMWNLHSRWTRVLVLRPWMECRPLTWIVQVLLQEWEPAHVEPRLLRLHPVILLAPSVLSGLVGTIRSSLHTSLHAYSANANSDSLQYPLHWPLLLQGNTKFFGIVDTGATSHLVLETMYLSNVQESHESVSWGNNSSSRATGVGSLYGITAGSIQPGGDGVLVLMLVTSGQLDSYALPDIDQILFSVPVWNAQGHTCDFGPHAAGLTIKTRTGKVRIPFVRQQSTMYWLMGVTKRTSGTTKHQRQHHAQCCNGHQTHSMQHGAQPIV